MLRPTSSETRSATAGPTGVLVIVTSIANHRASRCDIREDTVFIKFGAYAPCTFISSADDLIATKRSIETPVEWDVPAGSIIMAPSARVEFVGKLNSLRLAVAHSSIGRVAAGD